MAFLGETISATDLPTSDRSYDLIPEGWYSATISKAELGQTKSGTGTKIDMRYDITGPTHEGRIVFGSVNIRNQSQKAEEIGRQQLGAGRVEHFIGGQAIALYGVIGGGGPEDIQQPRRRGRPGLPGGLEHRHGPVGGGYLAVRAAGGRAGLFGVWHVASIGVEFAGILTLGYCLSIPQG